MTAETIYANLDTQMRHEWDTAYATTPLPSDWSLIDHGINELSTLNELLVQLGPSGRYANSDVVFLALITRAQDGEALAARLLLQQLQPRCRQLLATAAKRHLDDPVADVYAAAWQAIATYPLARSTKVRINLSMRVLNRLPAESDEPLLDLHEDLSTRVVDTNALTTPTEAARLLLWALDHDVITREEGALVYRATLDADTSSHAALGELATQAGITTRAMRNRYTRVVDKLAQAVLHTS